MKYKCIDLKYGKLHLIKTNKFRTIDIKIILKDEIKKEDITKRNFLTDMLIFSTKNYKTRKKLALKIQDLYSLYISANNMRVGNFLTTRISMSLLNPKYTEPNMLDESIDLLHEVIFNPNVKNNSFDKKSFDIIKHDILNEINTFKEDPKAYANLRMLENMDKNSPYSLHGFGYLEDLEEITTKNLYEYYKEFLTKSLVDIYIIGDFNFEDVLKLVKTKLDFKTIKKQKKDIYIKHQKINKTPKKIIENGKFNQSKLSIGCKVDDLTDFERKYVINLYSMILGGGFNSKFMQEIREKNSLAYYIHSFFMKADNILLIQSGISYDNFSKVVNNIKTIMKDMTKGKIDDVELQNVKTEYLSILEETLDNPDGIIESYLTADLLDLDTNEVKKENILKVSIDDIISVSKKVHLDTIYLLKGDLHEKD